MSNTRFFENAMKDESGVLMDLYLEDTPTKTIMQDINSFRAKGDPGKAIGLMTDDQFTGLIEYIDSAVDAKLTKSHPTGHRRAVGQKNAMKKSLRGMLVEK